MVGIIAAMKSEAEYICSVLTEKAERTISGMEFTSGKINGKDTVIAVCGMGKVFSSVCAQTMILEYQPEIIINTGVGGALSPELHVFNVAVGESAVQHDMDVSPMGIPEGTITELGITYFKFDTEASAKIKVCLEAEGVKCFMGVLATGDIFVSEKKLKDKLISRYNAIACDMESAAIAQVCYINNVKFTAVRAISDNADGNDMVAFPDFVAKAAVISAKAVIDFISN